MCVPIGASAVLAAVQFARGLAALGGGYPAEALGHLRRIHDPADPAYHAAVRCFTIGDLADAARRSGDPDGIRVFADEMETAAGQTPSPLLHAGLRYARALLAKDTDAAALFETALQSDMSTWPFLRARVQLAYGEWLHQQRQNAASRAPLRAAREAFDALGMIPWSERARQQLRATGETSRPRTAEARDRLNPAGTADRPDGRRGAEQPRDRPDALPVPSHRQLTPVPGLSQARDNVPDRAANRAQHQICHARAGVKPGRRAMMRSSSASSEIPWKS